MDIERLSKDCYMFRNECKHAANNDQAYIHYKGLPIYHMYDVDVHFGHESICMYMYVSYMPLCRVIIVCIGTSVAGIWLSLAVA